MGLGLAASEIVAEGPYCPYPSSSLTGAGHLPKLDAEGPYCLLTPSRQTGTGVGASVGVELGGGDSLGLNDVPNLGVGGGSLTGLDASLLSLADEGHQHALMGSAQQTDAQAAERRPPDTGELMQMS